MKQLQNEEAKKYEARDWNERLHDLTICPDCFTVQTKKKEQGDECDNEDCECFIQLYRKRLNWNNPNWG